MPSLPLFPLLLLVLILPTTLTSSVGCPSPTKDGCGMPSGPNWKPRWAMRSSLYTYCFIHCPLAFFKANENLGVFDGVVAFDHYWTKQGMPCINGIPQEFAAQNAITLSTKADFPGARVLQYRIGTAVPYAEIVHTAMVEHPEWFVRWHHAPNDNMTVCTVPPEAQTGRPGDNCSWEIRAGMYDFSQPLVQTWWVDNIIKPGMLYADGIWIDGDGPDNGAYECAGNYDFNNLKPPYPANNESEVDQFCAGEHDAVASAHEWLYANNGIDTQACVNYVVDVIPQRSDSSSVCASKVAASFALNDATVPIGFASDRTGAQGYTDDNAAVAIATFMLTRKEMWFFGVNQTSDTIALPIAALLLRDDGAPLGNMTTTGHTFTREFEHATVTLNCDTFTATFTSN